MRSPTSASCKKPVPLRRWTPYICSVFEVAQTDEGIDFIAMKHLEGETLQRRLERSPLSLKETLKLGAELSEALESAHAKGIVHGDLKPANIAQIYGLETRDPRRQLESATPSSSN